MSQILSIHSLQVCMLPPYFLIITLWCDIHKLSFYLKHPRWRMFSEVLSYVPVVWPNYLFRVKNLFFFQYHHPNPVYFCEPLIQLVLQNKQRLFKCLLSGEEAEEIVINFRFKFISGLSALKSYKFFLKWWQLLHKLFLCLEMKLL